MLEPGTKSQSPPPARSTFTTMVHERSKTSVALPAAERGRLPRWVAQNRPASGQVWPMLHQLGFLWGKSGDIPTEHGRHRSGLSGPKFTDFVRVTSKAGV